MSVDTPESGQHSQCRECGAFVTVHYARVFGDNSGDVHACPECSLEEDRFRGATGGVHR